MQPWQLQSFVLNSKGVQYYCEASVFGKSHYLGFVKKVVIILSALLLLHFFSPAQTGGNNTYEFLNLCMPARVIALGGTLISVKDNDINLSFQNPSLLDSVMHNYLSMSYVDYFADIKYGYVGYARQIHNIGNFSAGLQFFDGGVFTSTDITGAIIGQSTASEYSFNLSYSRPIDSIFAVGATIKTIYSKLGEYTSHGNVLDIGAVYNNKRKLYSAGLVMKNIGRQWKNYHIGNEPLPFEIQLGYSKKIEHAPFRLSFTLTHLEKWDITYTDPSVPTTDPITGLPIKKSKFSRFSDKLARHFIFGNEILISKNFHLRIGYNYKLRKEMKLESRPGIVGFSFGFGLKISKFHLSYGYAKYHVAGGPNHFTISTKLSEFYPKK